ncbi:hypothetical protein JW960_24090 [candidate division KSB1 bacterium]|nr:hypothetical protein [candidate division KSB1 bacterium]
MKTIIHSTILLLFSCSTLVAQSSIGFKNPGDDSLLKNYTLPTWGYNSLMIQTNNSISNSEQEQNGRSTKNSSSSFLVHPEYIIYKESETSIEHHNITINTLYEYSNTKQTAGFYNSEETNSRLAYNAIINSTYNRYVTYQSFILVDGNLQYDYYRNIKKEDNVKQTSINKNKYANFKIGLGIGHVRNISPVIRALRFNERYLKIVSTEKLSAQQISLLAKEITKISGYRQIYDRYEKYFWDNLGNIIGNNPTLSAFDWFYLRDALNENIGERFEGWDVSGGINLQNLWQKYRSMGFFGKYRYYKNLTLEQQIGFTLNTDYFEYIDDNLSNSQPYNGNVQIACEYLRLMTDKLLWRTSLSSNSRIGKITKSFFDGHQWYKQHSYFLSSTVSYFVENKATLSFRISYSSSNNYNAAFDNSLDLFNCSFSLSYYFNRNLF